MIETTSNQIGISANGSSLTTNIAGISAATRLASASTPVGGYETVASWTGYLAQGIVVRPHGVASGVVSVTTGSFTISRVA